MVRSIKNTFAPINQTPPEVFSLIPDYFGTDEELIKLTHVCHGWREVLISRASLWTYLDCRNLDKTGVYIQRSRESSLEVFVAARGSTRLPHDTLLLVLRHINRLRALTLLGTSHNIHKLVKHFSSPAPLLGKLTIRVLSPDPATVESTIFGGNLSSLRELRLWGGFTGLPWKNMTSLTILDLHGDSSNNISITQLLNFFERAHLLYEIRLTNSLPDSSNAPAERVVSLPHLRSLRILADSAHSILLNHLHVPTGALVMLEFSLTSGRSPIPKHLPRSFDNLQNVSHITSISLMFDSGVAMWIDGPSGSLGVFGSWDDPAIPPPMLDHRILCSLNKLPILTTERLAISRYDVPAHLNTEESGAYRALLPMNNLRALTLTDCHSVSFILTLNPNKNASKKMVCPELEKLVLQIPERRDESHIEGLLEMVMERASRGAKLSNIVILCPRKLLSPKEESDLRNYACHVEYKLDNAIPRWAPW